MIDNISIATEAAREARLTYQLVNNGLWDQFVSYNRANELLQADEESTIKNRRLR